MNRYLVGELRNQTKLLRREGRIETASVLCLVRLPHEDAASRHRVYQYVPILRDQYGILLYVLSLYSSRIFNNRRCASGSKYHVAIDALDLATRTTLATFMPVFYDAVMVLRDPAPFSIVPLLRLWRGLKKPVIYDFDDALHLYNPRIAKYIALSDVVTAGNEYLAAAARQYCGRVRVVPTTVYSASFAVKKSYHISGKLRVGWIGSPSTAPYLEAVADPLDALGQERPVEFVCVGGTPPSLRACSVTCVPWSLGIEQEMAATFDIAIAPLPDNDWTRGKCGLKVLEYMAAGVPTVASPVGVHTQMIIHGYNGLLAGNKSEWLDCLRKLANDKDQREKIGRAGRQFVTEHYDIRVGAKLLAESIRLALHKTRCWLPLGP